MKIVLQKGGTEDYAYVAEEHFTVCSTLDMCKRVPLYAVDVGLRGVQSALAIGVKSQ